ncbi:MAG: TIGR01459 family HAD-type hydrolase [Pseudomonadota bacterium]
MVVLIDTITDIADQFDAIVFDQWGVLHDGQAPYPSALQALSRLKAYALKLGVLSNSGKRAALNANRIKTKGFDITQFDTIMTSGEALWNKFATGQGHATCVFPIEGHPGDAANWSLGLKLTITEMIDQADGILLMGLPDGTREEGYDTVLAAGLGRAMPLYCSNPDLTSPRGGAYVMSPGVLARRYAEMGGTVHLFGKPHPEIFAAMQGALQCAPDKILMVGDSLHHDIQGAQHAGWSTLLVRGGIHAPDIDETRIEDDIHRLAAAAQIEPPTFSLPDLR